MSNIQWCDITANPIHLIRPDGSHGGHWCRKVSPGCASCYAEAQNQSNYFKFASKLPYTGSAPKNLIFDEKVMQELLHIRSPKKVFLCSMTDLFGEWVSDEWIDLTWAYMALASQHTFQILTKRPERMREYFRSCRNRIRFEAVGLGEKLGLRIKQYEPYLTYTYDWPLSNVWLGTSVENQKAADDRIPQLLQTPAHVRFLSCEPLLESIDLNKPFRTSNNGLILTWLDYLNWIIIGGESGSNARPCEIDWIRSIVQQCQPTNVAVFVKQLGSNPLQTACYIDGVAATYQKLKLKDKKGGTIDEFPEDLKIREFPHKPTNNKN
jgi:protein gp37